MGYVDNRVRWAGALKNFFSSLPYQISRFWSEHFNNRLTKLLRKNSYDFVQLEGLPLGLYIDTIREVSPESKIVLRAHNVEHQIWEQYCTHLSASPYRWYLKQQTRQLKKYELDLIQQVDALLPIAAPDKTYFQQHTTVPLEVVPIGLELSRYTPIEKGKSTSLKKLGFIGSLDWFPNQEGLSWFLEEVWPTLKDTHPKLTFHIAGRHPPAAIQKWERTDGITIKGEVPDALEFMRQQDAIVVPLLTGSGLRVKILEAMALELPVLTTTTGLKGITAEHKKQVWTADSPSDFADGLTWGQQNPKAWTQLGQQARQFVEKNYDIPVLSDALRSFYQQLTA
jgi:glycosyltransferase involved in cell wall biosynthesis